MLSKAGNLSPELVLLEKKNYTPSSLNPSLASMICQQKDTTNVRKRPLVSSLHARCFSIVTLFKKYSFFTSRAPARKVTALNPAPNKTSKVDPKRTQEELQSWSHSQSSQVMESSDQQNHPVNNLVELETPTSSDKVAPIFHLTPLVDPGTGTVGQESSGHEENLVSPPDHSTQDVQRAATTQGATTIISNNSQEKGASGVYSAPISASVRDIVASKEEQGLMISGLEEVRQSSSVFMLMAHINVP